MIDYFLKLWPIVKKYKFYIIAAVVAIILIYAVMAFLEPGEKPEREFLDKLEQYHRDTAAMAIQIRDLQEDNIRKEEEILFLRSMAEGYKSNIKNLQNEIKLLKQERVANDYIIHDLNIFEQYYKMSEFLENSKLKGGQADHDH